MEIAVDHRTPSLAAPPSGRSDFGSGAARESALRDVLAELGERVKPITLARERTLPVAAPFDRLLPDGLVRGHVVSCRGAAARSVAFGLVREAMAVGGWMAVVDVATLGTDAAAEFGVPLERVVRIDTGVDADTATDADWIDVMGAAVDGFDLVLTRVPVGLRGERRPAAVRKLSTRIQQKGAVVVTLGDAGALGADIGISTQRTVWSGLGDGTGHLRHRAVDLVAEGRRMPTTTTCSLELVGTGARVEFGHRDPVGPDPVGTPAVRDPQAELLAEMTDAVGELTDAAVDDRRLAG